MRLLSAWRAERELALVEAEVLGGVVVQVMRLGGMMRAPAHEPR